MARRNGDQPQQMHRIGVLRHLHDELAIDRLRLRELTGLMQSHRPVECLSDGDRGHWRQNFQS